jgi:hypothetical protein
MATSGFALQSLEGMNESRPEISFRQQAICLCFSSVRSYASAFGSSTQGVLNNRLHGRTNAAGLTELSQNI